MWSIDDVFLDEIGVEVKTAGEVDVPGDDVFHDDADEVDVESLDDIDYAKVSGKNPELLIGIKFHSRDEAREVVKTHCFRRDKKVNFDKIDASRLVASCRTVIGYSWRVRIAISRNGEPWQVRTTRDEHVGKLRIGSCREVH
ncbi:hypothetical protein M569_11380 [Genlisea aurea]|uniref:Transposase MuDR plant domain-containing protein n=1 Tax=Genlisea aurea TaxID=192259 RepID=S8C9G0_9LAMI|nr:hypothetical protein M569_11380 [Genlisea aurea]